MKRIAVILVVLLAAGAWAALPNFEQEVTADGGFSLASGGSHGPGGIIDVKAEGGTATIVFYKRANGPAGGAVVEVWPKSGSFALAADEPRPFDMTGSNPDSVYVDITTATKVVATW